MPGLPAAGGHFYVIERDRPAKASGLTLNLPADSSFAYTANLKITGNSTADRIRYAAVIPGAVIDQGDFPVLNGRFEYTFDPPSINRNITTYDIVNLRTGLSEFKDVVHLTFFSEERPAGAPRFHSFARVIIRGNRVIYVR